MTLFQTNVTCPTCGGPLKTLTHTVNKGLGQRAMTIVQCETHGEWSLELVMRHVTTYHQKPKKRARGGAIR